MAVHKEWKEVLKYAESIRDGKKIACHDLKLTVERFFQDLENPAYEIEKQREEIAQLRNTNLAMGANV